MTTPPSAAGCGSSPPAVWSSTGPRSPPRTPRREVSAVHLRPGPVGRGRRAGLQEPARGRTRVPGLEVHPGVAAGVPPPRTPHPRPRAALLARPAAGPGRRTPHRTDLAPHRHRTQPRPRIRRSTHQSGPYACPPTAGTRADGRLVFWLLQSHYAGFVFVVYAPGWPSGAPAREAPEPVAGSVSRLKSGRWRARYRDSTGREHARHFPRKADAQRWVAAHTASVDRGDWIDPALSRTTIEEWSGGRPLVCSAATARPDNQSVRVTVSRQFPLRVSHQPVFAHAD